MKNIKQIGMLLLAVLLVSCGSSKSKIATNNTKTVSITETLHDTVFKIEKNSSFYRALLVCRNGKIVVTDVTQAEPGRSLKSPRVRVENNKLIVDCEARAQELLAQWKSKQLKEVQIKTITKYTNQLTFWQKLQVWLGRIFVLVIILYSTRFTIKSYRFF